MVHEFANEASDEFEDFNCLYISWQNAIRRLNGHMAMCTVSILREMIDQQLVTSTSNNGTNGAHLCSASADVLRARLPFLFYFFNIAATGMHILDGGSVPSPDE